jgi:hypothetical protein
MSPARFRCANQLIVVLNLRYAADGSVAIQAIHIPAEQFTEKNASWRSFLRLANTDNNDWWAWSSWYDFAPRIRKFWWQDFHRSLMWTSRAKNGCRLKGASLRTISLHSIEAGTTSCSL